MLIVQQLSHVIKSGVKLLPCSNGLICISIVPMYGTYPIINPLVEGGELLGI